MNIYTLQYKDQEIEEKYQLEENFTSRQKLYKGLSFSGLIITILRISLSLINSTPMTDLLPELIFILIDIILYFILIRNPQHVWLGLITFNIILMFFQYSVQTSYNPQEAYLMGSNLMIGHCVIIFISDFKLSVVQVILLCAIRLGILEITNQREEIYQFFTTITAGLFFIVVLYKVDQLKRLSYLQRLKENQWDDVITKILVKPFVIFQFDNLKFQFSHKLSGDCMFCNTTEKLVQFLRLSQYRKKTLEQFIFSLQEKKKLNSQFTRTLLIMNEKKAQRIRLSSFYLTEHLFLIVFDDDTKNVKKVKEECYQNFLVNQKIFLHSIIQTYKKISKALRERDLAQITKVQLHQMIIYLKTKNSNLRSDQIKIKQIRIFKILQMINKIINFRAHFRNNDRFLKVSTISHQFILCLLETLSLFETNEYQIAYHLSLSKELILHISGDKLNINSTIKNKFPSIIQSIEVHNSVDSCRILLIFNRYPLVSFL